jgi:streptomycin 6-kinase
VAKRRSNMRVPPSVPKDLAHSTIELRGEAGAEWLKRLPALIADCEQRWQIKAGQPFSGLWVNWVAPARCANGTSAVLKLSFPEDKEFKTEAEALRLYNGCGVARLFQRDLERGAMLLERCEPGVPLAALENDAAATSIAARVMRRLWRPIPSEHGFPLVSDWALGLARLRRRFEGGTGPLPAALVEEAEELFAWLLPSQADPVLLHGDFHHENVLSARREPWLAIDPKGVVGEPAYDAGTLVREPPDLLDATHPGKVLARRLEQLPEELGLDHARVRGWALAQAVLAAYWGLEDSGRVWKEALVFAELLSAIKD